MTEESSRASHRGCARALLAGIGATIYCGYFNLEETCGAAAILVKHPDPAHIGEAVIRIFDSSTDVPLA